MLVHPVESFGLFFLNAVTAVIRFSIFLQFYYLCDGLCAVLTQLSILRLKISENEFSITAVFFHL